MKLIPVVEFEPFQFETPGRQRPGDTQNEPNAEDWDKYWRDSLADSGITNIDPYAMSSWFIEVGKLTSEIVEILLGKTYKEGIENTTDAEEMNFSSFPGGYVLEVSETVQIFPECCGYLADIHNWEEASNWGIFFQVLLYSN